MGGTTSKLEATDWKLANGKLESDQETLDGAPPTGEYQVFHLIKKGVNQREFDVTDEQDNLLYTTKQVPGTIACFDVLGKEMDAYLLRVNVDLARRYWTVSRYQVATFEGQKPDKVATEKVAAERLLDVERQESSHTVESFHTPLLFRKACITVSWSRYMAVATMFGTPSQAQLDKYNRPDTDDEEEISEEMMELQDSAGETKQRNSIFRRASRMTERIRARTSSTASAKVDYYKPIKITGVNNPNALGSYDDDSDSDKSGPNRNNTNNHDLSSSPSSPPLASEGVEVPLEASTIDDNIEEQDKQDSSSINNSTDAQDEHDNTDDKVESISALNEKSECADTVEGTPENAHVDESGTCTGVGPSSEIEIDSSGSAAPLESAMRADSGCNARSAIGTASSTTVEQNVASSALSTTERPPIRQSNSMPIMKGPPLDPDELPTENDGTEGESLAIPPERPVPERPYSSMPSAPQQRGLPGRPYNSFTSSLKRETLDGSSSTTARTKTIGKWIRQQSQSFRDTYSRPKKPKKEDPLEGVIRLDQPLLLCQEIYNKIIGNHQTSLVSKERVVELLQQDEAQHQLEKKNDKDGNDDGENVVLTQEILESAAAVANKQHSPSSPGCGVAESKSNDDDDSSPGNGVAEHKSNDDTETADELSSVPSADGATTEGGTDANDAGEEDQGGDGDQQPLVGYWAWENTLRTHKMKMHVAKGSDLALHVVLAIIVNQVRYERNAIAMTI